MLVGVPFPDYDRAKYLKGGHLSRPQALTIFNSIYEALNIPLEEVPLLLNDDIVKNIANERLRIGK